MNFLRLSAVLMISTLFFLAGCGSGGGDRNGSVKVTASKVDNGNNTSDVAFTVQYTNSQVTDYQGLDATISATISPSVAGFPDNFTWVFDSTGAKIFTYTSVPSAHTISLSAKVGDIVSSASMFISNSSLNVVPAILNFQIGAAVGQQLSAAISGGAPAYGASSSTADISASVSGTTLTVAIVNQNTSATAKTATITVTDSATNSKPVTVNY